MKIANGLVLDFTVDNADTAADTFLGLNASGEVTKFASVPRSRVSGGGNITEATSSVLSITGGTAAVLTSGLTIQVLQAGAAQSGYLSTTDWNTFNNKLGPSLTSAYIYVGNGSNVATGVAVSGDITMSNAGVVAIASGVIVNADINASAAIAVSKLAAVTASRVLGSDGSGFIQALDTATYPSFTELAYGKGVTSSIQTQLNNRLAVTLSSPTNGDVITYNGAAWVNSPSSTGVPTGGTTAQILRKIDNTNYNTEWHTLVAADITDVSSTAAELNLLDGVTTTTAQFNFLNTVSGDVQSQLDAKLASSLTLNNIWVGNVSNIPTQLAAGTNGYVLTSVSGVPTWVSPGVGGTVTSVAASGGTTGMSFTGSPITTSGTLTLTGTLAIANGGTNLTALGTANQLLRVNAGATALEYFGAFLDNTLLMRNVANTFSSRFTNTNTSSQVYTLPDATGTVALTSNLSSWLTGSLTGDILIDGLLARKIEFVGLTEFEASTATNSLIIGSTDVSLTSSAGDITITSGDLTTVKGENGAYFQLNDIYGSDYPGLQIQGTFLRLKHQWGQIGFESNGLVFTDDRATKKGLEYFADYSANYSSRSLTDKAYVDSVGATAGNGLTKTTGVIKLGGTVTESTTVTINNASFPLSIVNASNGAGLNVNSSTAALTSTSGVDFRTGSFGGSITAPVVPFTIYWGDDGGGSTLPYMTFAADNSLSIDAVAAVTVNSTYGLSVTSDVQNNFYIAGGGGSLVMDATTAFLDISGASTGIYVTDGNIDFNTNGTLTFNHGAGALFPASTTSIASLNIAHGAAPSSPVNGDFWSTTSGFYGRVNGATVGPFGAGGGYTNLTQFVAQTNWRNFYSNGSGDVTELAFGALGTVFKSAGASAAPIWQYPNPVRQVTLTANNYTLVEADYGAILEVDNGGTAATVTLPTGLPEDWSCSVVNRGTGIVTLTTSGSTLNSEGTTIEVRYTGVNIYHRGSNVFVATGSLGAALTLSNITGTLPVASGGTNITSYAIGDLIQATGATTLSKLASVSAGSFLRSGGVTTASAWSTVKLPDTMSALGIWVANTANTAVNLTVTANQSIRMNAAGNAWEAYTPSGGGIGGSTGGTDNSVLRADGAGGSTLQNSALFIDDSGHLTLGTGIAGTVRNIIADSSGASAGLAFSTKGSGTISAAGQFLVTESASLSSGLFAMHVGTGSVSSPMNQFGVFPTSSGLSIIHTRLSAGTGNFNITAASGHASTATGASLVLTAGSGHNSGVTDAGHIYLMYGVKNSTGKDGNIGLLTNSVANWQSMERGLFIADSLTAPTGNPSNGLFKWVDGTNKKMSVRDEDGNVYDETPRNGTITIELYNGGSDLTTGIKDTPVQVPYGATVVGWEIAAYNSSNALLSTSTVVDILSDTFANLPLAGSDSIAGSEKPTLSGASTNSDNTITTWSVITSGNYIQAEIESVSAGVAKVVVTIKVKRTS